MATISAPYGAQPTSDSVGTIRPMRIPNGITSGLASNIFKYQPVKMDPVTGTITPCTNTGGVPDPIWGIFAGVEFTPLGGRPAESPFWPSGTVIDPTNNFFVYVWPAWIPSMRVLIQADGSVAQTALGQSFNFSNLSSGNTTTGLSACTAAYAGVAAGSQGQLTLVEFGVGINDAIGDAYTNLICEIAYPQIGPAAQVSIG